MKSMSRVMAWVLLLAVSLVVAGCSKKEPAPPPVEPPSGPTEEMPQEVEPAPAPESQDQTPSPLEGELVEANKYALEQGLLGHIYFDFDKYDLKPDARERLAKNADFMKENPQFVFTIEGHCDERGTNAYNIALGDRRATAAKDYLVSLGVSPTRLKTISYGEEQPVCMESNESCWQRNRRAHFVISGRM